MGKFIKSSDAYKRNLPEGASWSDTDGFYTRVNWLANESHSASNDDEDVIDYLMCLEQLHLEIEGTITNETEREELETIRLRVKKWLYDPKNSKKSLGAKREQVRKYHSSINYLCHRYGLFLKKSLRRTLDNWNNDTKGQKFKSWEEIKIQINTQDNNRQPTLIRQL